MTIQMTYVHAKYSLFFFIHLFLVVYDEVMLCLIVNVVCVCVYVCVSKLAPCLASLLP